MTGDKRRASFRATASSRGSPTRVPPTRVPPEPVKTAPDPQRVSETTSRKQEVSLPDGGTVLPGVRPLLVLRRRAGGAEADGEGVLDRCLSSPRHSQTDQAAPSSSVRIRSPCSPLLSANHHPLSSHHQRLTATIKLLPV